MFDRLIHRWLRVPYTLNVHYFCRPDNPKSTILLIHGLGTSWRTWRPLDPYLPKDTQVIAIDMLGFGSADAKAINEFCQKLMEGAPNIDKSVQIKIANLVEVNKNYTLKPGFKNTAENAYKAQVESADLTTGVKSIPTTSFRRFWKKSSPQLYLICSMPSTLRVFGQTNLMSTKQKTSLLEVPKVCRQMYRQCTRKKFCYITRMMFTLRFIYLTVTADIVWRCYCPTKAKPRLM